ncbi:MAG: DUF2267 domain-containing protein [Okeania sp. SIO2D1]|nr:DUF2267 domain-containing protein [Okeania sp. SIO2D1]
MNTYNAIAQSNVNFLTKIQNRANLQDIYDARDLAEVVYRTIRDLMPREMIDRVSSDLQERQNTDNPLGEKSEIVQLWQDRNPLVAWLSRVRPAFKGEVPYTFDDKLFVTRVEQEGGMPRGTDGETVIKAVFAATKDELSEARVKEVAEFLPGKIKEFWQLA